MTKLVILSPAERRRFDSPPNFTGDERSVYFSLPADVVERHRHISTMFKKKFSKHS